MAFCLLLVAASTYSLLAVSLQYESIYRMEFFKEVTKCSEGLECDPCLFQSVMDEGNVTEGVFLRRDRLITEIFTENWNRTCEPSKIKSSIYEFFFARETEE